jgi:chemotaxis protein methyltransferase CheR
MATNEKPLELPVGVFLILRELIRDRLGFAFEDDKRDLLAVKLADRASDLGLPSYLEYYYLLKYGPDAEAEWPRLIDALSVQETFFWREVEQITALVDVLVPQHVAANRGPVRIWSAACASGEEPLSIAMALAEAGWFQRAEIEIRASDASPAALAKARRGVYRERAFRALPLRLREQFFVSVDGGWQVAQDLHSRIRFSSANLLEQDETAELASAPFIYCRNVFIYFSATTIARVVRSFVERMPTPGYLFVGAAESLMRIATPLQLEEVGGAFVYVKR